MRRHVKIGEKVVEKLSYYPEGYEKLEGTVIWIHPRGRFYRVRFKLKNGAYVTESYILARKMGDGYD